MSKDSRIVVSYKTSINIKHDVTSKDSFVKWGAAIAQFYLWSSLEWGTWPRKNNSELRWYDYPWRPQVLECEISKNIFCDWLSYQGCHFVTVPITSHGVQSVQLACLEKGKNSRSIHCPHSSNFSPQEPCELGGIETEWLSGPKLLRKLPWLRVDLNLSLPSPT